MLINMLRTPGGKALEWERLAKGAICLPIAFSMVASPIALAQIQPGMNVPGGSPLDPSLQRSTDSTSSDSRASSTVAPISTGEAIEPVTVSGGTGGGSRTLEDTFLQQRLLLSGNSDALDIRNPRLKPPASPGEYERWVQDVTGRQLKRFGADLLLPSNRDYAVPATSSVPPDYALNIGDVVSITMTGSVEGSAEVEIDRAGRIYLPRVGSIKLLGVRYRDLKDRVAAAIGQKYRNFDISVSIAQLRGVRVYVTGFANNPGAYSVNSLSTLVNAVLASGGPSAGGSFRSVKLYRHGNEIADFDLYELLRKGNKSRDVILQNEDVLFIPPAGRQVAVIGSVNEEAIYETLPQESLEDVLSLAGGTTNLAESSRLVLYRLSDRDTSWNRQVPRTTAATEIAQAGDIIQILPQGSLARPLERQSTIVRIEGEVNNPGNYYVSPNTPLSTVLEMAGGLTQRAFVFGTKLSRESVRAQQREGYREALDQMETVLAAAPLTQDSSIDPGQRQTQLASARSVLDRLRSAEPDGRLVLDLAPDASILPGDIILENNDRIVIPPRVNTVGVFGAVYRPASFLLGTTPKRVSDYIEHAGGTMRAADQGNVLLVRANGEVLTRKRGALSARVVPGDIVFVPVKTQSSSVLAKIKDITQMIFQLGLTAAVVAGIN